MHVITLKRHPILQIVGIDMSDAAPSTRPPSNGSLAHGEHFWKNAAPRQHTGEARR